MWILTFLEAYMSFERASSFPFFRLFHALQTKFAKDELLKSIRAVSKGRKYIPSDVAGAVAEHLGQEDLTPRELEVLELIRDGNKNKQIANRLTISETTVNFHIKNIVDKLQANDRTHAVTIALRRGLLEM